MRLLLFFWLLLLPGVAQEQPTFVRVTQKPDALQTAISHYVTPKGVKIDLVAVVHVGESDYYQALDKQLKSYDAVLFEAILDDGGHVTRKQTMADAIGLEDYEPQVEMRSDPSNPLTAVQMKLCAILGLAYQPTAMDYSGANFVHADMTSSQFEKAMEKRGESATQLFLKLLKKSLADSDSVDPELATLNPLVFLARDPTAGERLALRRLLARHIGDVEGMAVELHGTTLLTGRNQQCLLVLRKQLKKGKKRLAILYGAAHMPDLDRRLVSELKCKRSGQNWLTAWKLR